MRTDVVYIKSPKFKKSGRTLQGTHYGLDWIDGYAGPFHRNNPQFMQLWGKVPGGSSLVSQADWLRTEAGRNYLAAQRSIVSDAEADAVLREREILKQAERSLKQAEKVYIIRERAGLLNPPESIWDDIKTGIDSRKNRGGDMMRRINAWKRVLDNAATNGEWDRKRFDGALKDEWRQFQLEVISQIFTGNDLRDMRAPGSTEPEIKKQKMSLKIQEAEKLPDPMAAAMAGSVRMGAPNPLQEANLVYGQ